MDAAPGRRRLILAAALIGFADPAARAERPAVPASLVNGASRLAMLAERMAKLHAQIGREVLVPRSRRGLGEASAAFERGLGEMTAAAHTAELRENYRLLRLLWDEYRSATRQPPTPESGRQLADRAEEVAWIAAKGARLFFDQARSRAAELVMSAGTARAAGQRLGRIHLQRGWALAANAAPREVKRAEAEIFLALAQLNSAAETTEEAAASLRMTETQVAFLRQAVERLGQGKERSLQLEHIAKSADHIAEAMDTVAKSYEDVGGG